MLAVSALLILVTIVDGFGVAESTLFICLECFVNLIITLDFLARFKLTGVQKFFTKSSGKLNLWNFFDLSVVLACNGLFLIAVFMQHGTLKNLNESLEEAVLVVWGVW